MPTWLSHPEHIKAIRTQHDMDHAYDNITSECTHPNDTVSNFADTIADLDKEHTDSWWILVFLFWVLSLVGFRVYRGSGSEFGFRV